MSQSTDAPLAPAGAVASAPPARSPFWRYCPVMAGLLVLALYVSYYALRIYQQDTVPSFDQTNYITRVYEIGRHLHTKGWFHLSTWLGGAYANRPPLMMIPAAILWGVHASWQNIAMSWLLIRAAVLALSCGLLARIVGDRRVWLPMMLLACGSQFLLLTDPQRYMMDQSLEIFGLLALVAMLYELRRPSAGTAFGMGAAGIAMFLVKPVALSYLFPMYAVIALRALTCFIPQLRRRQWRPALYWALAYVPIGFIFIRLLTSAYGHAIRDQWAVNAQGWWNSPFQYSMLASHLVVIIPPWLLLVALLVFLRHKWSIVSRWQIAGGTIAVLWWYIFNVFILNIKTHRVTVTIALAACALALFIIVRSRRWLMGVTAFAGLLFVVNMGITLFAHQPAWLTTASYALGPMGVAAPPVRDPGVMQFVRQMQATLTAASPGNDKIPLLVVMDDDYISYAGMVLAARRINHAQPGPIAFESSPIGTDEFDMHALLSTRWVATKTPRADDPPLDATMYETLDALHALFTDPKSPIIDQYAKRIALPVEMPRPRGDNLIARDWPRPPVAETLLLLERTKPLTAADEAAALQFILPRYTGPVADRLGRRIDQLRIDMGMAARGLVSPGVAWTTPAEAAAFLQTAQPAPRDVAFGPHLVLRGIHLARRPDGYLEARLLWHTNAAITLDGTLFVHITDDQGKILHGADTALSPHPGTVEAGSSWQQRLVIEPLKLAGGKRFALAVQFAGETIPVPVKGGTLDWDNHRLWMPLP